MEAIKWESNEPEIREFVGDDDSLRFRDRGLEVWNEDNQTWENCAIFSYIAKNTKGHFFVISPDDMERMYSVIE